MICIVISIQKYYFFFHLVAVCKIALLSYCSLRVSTIGLITISVVVTDRVQNDNLQHVVDVWKDLVCCHDGAW